MEHENLIVITQIDHHQYNGLIVQQTTSRKGGVGGASGLKQPKGTFLRGPLGSPSRISQTEEMFLWETVSFPANPLLISTDLT